MKNPYKFTEREWKEGQLPYLKYVRWNRKKSGMSVKKIDKQIAKLSQGKLLLI